MVVENWCSGLYELRRLRVVGDVEPRYLLDRAIVYLRSPLLSSRNYDRNYGEYAFVMSLTVMVEI